MINNLMQNLIQKFEKILLWQKVFFLLIISLIVYFIVSISLYHNWNNNIKKLNDDNNDLLNKITKADLLFEKKADLIDEKAKIIKELVSKTTTEVNFLQAIRSFCNENAIRIDLLDTFTVIKDYQQIIRKRYVLKLRVARFEQINSLMRYLTTKTIFRTLKFEYDNGYLDLELDLLFTK